MARALAALLEILPPVGWFFMHRQGWHMPTPVLSLRGCLKHIAALPFTSSNLIGI
jgi:hypothetical protein